MTKLTLGDIENAISLMPAHRLRSLIRTINIELKERNNSAVWSGSASKEEKE
jgi:hypothetical protein